MRLAVATTTRADWGLLQPLARAIDASPGFDVDIIAGNMHFAKELGETWHEIIDDGFSIAASVPASGSPGEIMATTLSGFYDVFHSRHYDGLILLGDRYEALAVASAAMMSGVPIAHIAGGTISEGAVDDSIRHAITKLSVLHLCETEDYRRRVIQLGEEPSRVFNTGAIGIHNILNTPVMSVEELEDSIGFKLGDNTILCTLHAATLDTLPAEQQFREMTAAFDSIPGYRLLITYPNNDVDPAPLIRILKDYRDLHPDRVCLIPSLGRKRYLTALRHVVAVVGNSSSGIVEVPSMKIPVLDIGIRQRGRSAADCVIHCGSDRHSIAQGLEKILSEEARQRARQTVNPYFRPDTLELMTQAITGFNWEKGPTKKFFDIDFKL